MSETAQAIDTHPGADIDLTGLRWADLPDLLTEGELAQIMRLHPSTLRGRRFALSRDPSRVSLCPPFVRIGRRVRWQKDTVRRWLDDHETTDNLGQHVRRRDGESTDEG